MKLAETAPRPPPFQTSRRLKTAKKASNFPQFPLIFPKSKHMHDDLDLSIKERWGGKGVYVMMILHARVLSQRSGVGGTPPN